jgi:hypothetical protein
VQRIRTKLTYSNVVSTLCLVLLVGGGTAFAAKSILPKNSVGAKQIKKGAITPAKLNKTTRTSLVGARGATGPTGAPGPQGPKGEPGLSNAFYATNNDQTLKEKKISLTVPPGNYLVTASMFASNEEAKEGRVGCDLISPQDRAHEGSAVANMPKAPTETIFGYQQPEAQSVFALPRGGTVTFECGNFEGMAKITFYNAQLTATTIGSISG